MTTGDLFTPRQQPQKYRQGNYQESLYPLNERPAVRSQNESLYTQILDDGVELSTVNDYSSALGPNSITIADPLTSNEYFFADQSVTESRYRPSFVHDTSSKCNPVSPSSDDVSTTPAAKTQLDIKKERKKNREEKQKANEIQYEQLDGYIGRNDVDEILTYLDPERAEHEKAAFQEKKKKKKGGGIRKNKALRNTKELDVEVELDKDDVVTPATPLTSNGSNGSSGDIAVEDEINGVEKSPTPEMENNTGVSITPVTKESKVCSSDITEKAETDNVSSKTVPTTNHMEKKRPSLEEKKGPSVEEKKNEEILKSSWTTFLKNYRNKIHYYDDRPLDKPNNRKEPPAKRRIDISGTSANAQKDNKPQGYRSNDRRTRR